MEKASDVLHSTHSVHSGCLKLSRKLQTLDLKWPFSPSSTYIVAQVCVLCVGREKTWHCTKSTWVIHGLDDGYVSFSLVVRYALWFWLLWLLIEQNSRYSCTYGLCFDESDTSGVWNQVPVRSTKKRIQREISISLCQFDKPLLCLSSLLFRGESTKPETAFWAEQSQSSTSLRVEATCSQDFSEAHVWLRRSVPVGLWVNCVATPSPWRRCSNQANCTHVYLANRYSDRPWSASLPPPAALLSGRAMNQRITRSNTGNDSAALGVGGACTHLCFFPRRQAHLQVFLRVAGVWCNYRTSSGNESTQDNTAVLLRSCFLFQFFSRRRKSPTTECVSFVHVFVWRVHSFKERLCSGSPCCT